MGINHRGGYVLVSEQLLHGPDVLSFLQQVRGERMTKRVAGSRLADSGRAYRRLHPVR